ncbi:hypothetical protein BST22_07040 [Mycolicibacterium chubuense]|uniref:Uncharacterized protein n=1 Tax=Mycolicibacterium chubuense TaxID=1800 RepID=A0A0J6W7G8_MYCCU|nr:hypothetical protein MCHUDSM44219_03231 [Mycolicibacterium chubuense]ORA54362.1 hypothetical protein BST22_07040 [Mycolicibacterium chubuense]SPX96654.1 Uncharacterised protein [Mycolicibacterium chubuense]
MRVVGDLTTRTVTLDFSSSDGPHERVTQIAIDGAVFANAAELSSWGAARVQVHLCEQCGMEHCASGSWLVVRNVGIGAAFIPAFDEMLAGEWEQREYAPPYFAQGLPIFTPDDYATLRRWCVGLPPMDALPLLTGDEILRVLQWEAPAHALGVFPADVELDQDLVLAVSDGGHADAAVLLEEAIEPTRGTGRASLETSSLSAQAITFYLNASGTPEWTPLYVVNDRPRLAAPTTGYLVEALPHAIQNGGGS